MKTYLDLTKFGIVIFVLLSGLAGYAVSYPIGFALEMWQPILLFLGLYLVSSGSFAINQAQEWKLDAKMPRTQGRPIPSGKVAPWQAYALGALYVIFGLFFLYLLSETSAVVALLTVVLYNGIYTLYWKRKWAFGAVPGAIPGALPVTIGYAVNQADIFSSESVYLFMIMFLWQMPHFWSLAIRYREDYEAGGFPVLPSIIGDERTRYHIGLYIFVYAAFALAAPWFINVDWFYLVLIVPFALKVIYEFWKYFGTTDEKRWLPFFLWVNLSMLVFLAAPVFDKWVFYLFYVS